MIVSHFHHEHSRLKKKFLLFWLRHCMETKKLLQDRKTPWSQRTCCITNSKHENSFLYIKIFEPIILLHSIIFVYYNIINKNGPKMQAKKKKTQQHRNEKLSQKTPSIHRGKYVFNIFFAVCVITFNSDNYTFKINMLLIGFGCICLSCFYWMNV